MRSTPAPGRMAPAALRLSSRPPGPAANGRTRRRTARDGITRPGPSGLPGPAPRVTEGGGRMADTARTLLVLRHAKAAGEPGVNDLQRPLTGRGRRNADEAGRWLLAQGLGPGRVVCSTAQRARETSARQRRTLTR